MHDLDDVPPGLVIRGRLGQRRLTVSGGLSLYTAIIAALVSVGAALLLAVIGDTVLTGVALWCVPVIAAVWLILGVLYPPIRAHLSATTLTIQQHTWPLDQIEHVEVERMETFAHLYIVTPRGRRCVASHRDKAAVSALAVWLERDIARSPRELGTPADIPASLQALQGAARSDTQRPLRDS